MLNRLHFISDAEISIGFLISFVFLQFILGKEKMPSQFYFPLLLAHTFLSCARMYTHAHIYYIYFFFFFFLNLNKLRINKSVSTRKIFFRRVRSLLIQLSVKQ